MPTSIHQLNLSFMVLGRDFGAKLAFLNKSNRIISNAIQAQRF